MEVICFVLYLGCVISTLYVINKREQLSLFLAFWSFICWPIALIFAALLPKGTNTEPVPEKYIMQKDGRWVKAAAGWYQGSLVK